MGSWAIEPSSRELTPLDAGEVASGRQSSGPPGLSPWLPQPQCSCPRRLRPFALSSIMMLPAPSRADCSAASCGDPLPLERATASGRRSSRGDALPIPPPDTQRAWDVAFLVARRRLGVSQEGLTWRRVFCSPNASRDSEPELTLQDQLRKLQQRREEEARRRQRRGEERRLQKLRAGQQALPDRVPALPSAGASPARPAPSGEPEQFRGW